MRGGVSCYPTWPETGALVPSAAGLPRQRSQQHDCAPWARGWRFREQSAERAQASGLCVLVHCPLSPALSGAPMTGGTLLHPDSGFRLQLLPSSHSQEAPALGAGGCPEPCEPCAPR